MPGEEFAQGFAGEATSAAGGAEGPKCMCCSCDRSSQIYRSCGLSKAFLFYFNLCKSRIDRLVTHYFEIKKDINESGCAACSGRD